MMICISSQGTLSLTGSCHDRLRHRPCCMAGHCNIATAQSPRQCLHTRCSHISPHANTATYMPHHNKAAAPPAKAAPQQLSPHTFPCTRVAGAVLLKTSAQQGAAPAQLHRAPAAMFAAGSPHELPCTVVMPPPTHKHTLSQPITMSARHRCERCTVPAAPQPCSPVKQWSDRRHSRWQRRNLGHTSLVVNCCATQSIRLAENKSALVGKTHHASCSCSRAGPPIRMPGQHMPATRGYLAVKSGVIKLLPKDRGSCKNKF